MAGRARSKYQRLTLRIEGKKGIVLAAEPTSGIKRQRVATPDDDAPFLTFGAGAEAQVPLQGVRPWAEVFAPDGQIGRVERLDAQVVEAIVPAAALEEPIRFVPAGASARRGLAAPAPLQLPTGPRSALVFGLSAPEVHALPFGATSDNALKLVFLSEGFRSDDLPLYHAAVDGFLSQLAVTEPFAGHLAAILPIRLDVASPESGIDDPKTGVLVDTAFAGRFGTGTLRYRIEVDQGAAERAAKRLAGATKRDAIVVVANTEEYGGSGGRAAVFSRHAASAQIALHELGHSLFGLADEYSHEGPRGQPREPNVTAKPNASSTAWTDKDLAKLKWRALVTPGVEIPTHRNDDCSQPSDPPAIAGVGMFEGARYEHCGLFRPTANCKMRELTAEFCPVCQDVIRKRLREHL